jgi:hypothetical protein
MTATLMPGNISGNQAADNLFQHIIKHLAGIRS